MEKIKLFLTRWWIVLVLVVFLPVYTQIAVNNERSVDYVNNGFFTFWLSGKMIWTGEQPYSSADWVGEHHPNGAVWIPNQIFPYPLPLALFTAPLGLLPIDQAYRLWDVLAQLLIAGSLLWLATHWEGLNRQLFVVFVLVATVLNGNVMLGLMTGTFAAFFLVFLALGLYFLETRHPILAGISLAMLALKPPLLTVVMLIGIWLLFRRDWKTIGGILLGGLGLFFVGLIQDPRWVQKFLGAGGNLFSLRLGHQPTIVSYTRLLCGGEMNCAFLSYALVASLLVVLFTFLVWKQQRRLTPLTAFSAAIALGVLLPPYLWSYDYTILVLPIGYVAFDLIRRRETYVYSTLFLLALDLLSIAGLILFWKNPDSLSLTIQRDMWSILVALLVLVMTWTLVFSTAGEAVISGENQGP
jgi:hypothetical protein